MVEGAGVTIDHVVLALAPGAVTDLIGLVTMMGKSSMVFVDPDEPRPSNIETLALFHQPK
jgi:hypothetical protein